LSTRAIRRTGVVRFVATKGRRWLVKIGFVGLGRMGAGIAWRLVAAGHELVVYNRTSDKAKPFADKGVNVAGSAREAAQGADALITMLADDAAVESAVLGDGGALGALGPRGVHISMSTISPDLSNRLGRAHQQAKERYVAAPVVGRPKAAEEGELVLVVAGSPDAVTDMKPVFDAVGKETHVLGEEPEKANAVKLGVNLFLGIMVEALGEVYALAEGYGIEDAAFLAILNGAVFKSPVIDGYGKIIAEHRFEPAGFRLDLGAKDVRLAVQAAERKIVPLPLGAVLRDRFLAAEALGNAEQDWSAVGRVSTDRRVGAGLAPLP
jgi:3-hydroxyisobutyrate dehydrogenase-like beta-hydroxyacid dehydrogenase